MSWGRFRLLIIGFCGSAGMICLLILNCTAGNRVSAVTPMGMTLPYTFSDCSLILHQITAYEGAYLEGNPDYEVVDVAAILIENTGATIWL